MAKHIHLGKKGEELAAIQLKVWGYHIVAQNWRHGHWEIDIIALKDNILHFVEVKTRSSANMGYPEENVTEKKLRTLIDASEAFCEQHPIGEKIQFDILSVVLNKQKTTFLFIEDVFI